MAYTYDDFLSAANAAGMTDRFSKNDLMTAQRNPEYGMSMLGLMKDIQNAGTDEQRLLATEAANQMRKNYGIYNTGNSAADYSYASSYGSVIDDMMGKIKDYGPFSYDPEQDSSYNAYKKLYLREGERAGANAMAQAAAASGGVPSSYAVTAGQQAGNYYAGQLADMLPTLEQNAYQEYIKNFGMLQDKLGTYQQQDATDYQRYLDAYNKQVQTEQTAYERAMTLYKMLGYATPEVAEILGIPASRGRSSGSGYGWRGTGGSGDGETGDGGTGDQYNSVDLGSILKLGYGPISANKLNSLVASGAVEEYVDGGSIKFRNSGTSQTKPNYSIYSPPRIPYTPTMGEKKNGSGNGGR